jgi:hypothetical protein
MALSSVDASCSLILTKEQYHELRKALVNKARMIQCGIDTVSIMDICCFKLLNPINDARFHEICITELAEKYKDRFNFENDYIYTVEGYENRLKNDSFDAPDGKAFFFELDKEVKDIKDGATHVIYESYPNKQN